MQRNLKVTGINELALFLVLLSVTILTSCNDKTGPVGGSIIPVSEVSYDTLMATGFNATSLDGYGGKLTFFPIGRYNDQLFGDVESIAYLKPAITGVALDTTLSTDYTMYLDLVFDSVSVYGDSLSQSDFAIYKVMEGWRGNEFQLSSKPSYDNTIPIATFTKERQDSIRIELSDAWLTEYATILNDTSATQDSTFLYDFFGLAIVPTGGSSKITFPTISQSRFWLINGAIGDTNSVRIQDWAYNLNRTNAAPVPGRLTLINSLEKLYNLNLKDELDSLKAQNLLKAELILYEDTEQLQNTLPLNHTRLYVNGVALKNGFSTSLEYDLFFKEPNSSGFYDSKNNAYRFDITSLVNTYIFGTPSSDDIYLDIRPSNGLLRSTILYDETAPDSLKQPKLILTTAK